MTSYKGLPEKHRALVVEFREALVHKLVEQHGSLGIEEDFTDIDETYRAEGKRLAEQEDSPHRAQNWKNTYHGAAESQKLRIAFELAQNMLTEDEITACAPAEIESDGICFSRYEMEKNGLSDMTDYLVPKQIRDIGLF